jgi:hypothetical protein
VSEEVKEASGCSIEAWERERRGKPKLEPVSGTIKALFKFY